MAYSVLPTNDGEEPPGPSRPRTKLQEFAGSKGGRIGIALFFFFTIALVANSLLNPSLPSRFYENVDTSNLHAPVPAATHDKSQGNLHLLIPATSSNVNLCKLMLSTQILGYPTPILINYGDVEDKTDEYKQHITKVQGILSYITQLEARTEGKDDLVLIVDGYDLWFQLPPDVLLERYFAMNAKMDERTKALYGEKAFKEHDMRQTIVFNGDKLCWPIDFSRPACWAVPLEGYSDYAFGPETNKGKRELSLPRWLNSGVIMGPVNDLLPMFQETLAAIMRNHTTDSDQFYFAEVFGLQEYTRLEREPQLLEQVKSVKHWGLNDLGRQVDEPMVRNVPNFPPDMAKTEYHIGIDYICHAFQTFAFWKSFLAWTRPMDAWKPPRSYPKLSYGGIGREQRDFALPEDMQRAAPPYFRLTKSQPAERFPGWEGVNLLYNTVTDVFPVLIHFTGEKNFREIWWEQSWFQSRAADLQRAAIADESNLISRRKLGGKYWYSARIGALEARAEDGSTGGGLSPNDGAWADTGAWLSWNTLCRAHETTLFGPPVKDYYHPRPGTDERYGPVDMGKVEAKMMLLEAERLKVVDGAAKAPALAKGPEEAVGHGNAFEAVVAGDGKAADVAQAKALEAERTSEPLLFDTGKPDVPVPAQAVETGSTEPQAESKPQAQTEAGEEAPNALDGGSDNITDKVNQTHYDANIDADANADADADTDADSDSHELDPQN